MLISHHLFTGQLWGCVFVQYERKQMKPNFVLTADSDMFQTHLIV